MFEAIIKFAIKRKLFVALIVVAILTGGIWSMMTLPIDAVPDITNNQVQIVTVSPTLAPQEVEQLITMPVETAMSNMMNVKEIRSVSRFGLSLVTVVFDDNVPTLEARQLTNEQIQTLAGEIPEELGAPELMPVTTGLGEIYQYVLRVDSGYKDKYDAMELRTIQDWIVKRQLAGIPGIVEINSFGGYLKQYEIALDPDALAALKITIGEVFEALEKNNQNTGGSYIEKVNKAYYIRSEGMISKLKDIEKIVVTNRGGMPVHVCDIGRVDFGAPKRFGAMTMDGEDECVGGIAMMLKGANANAVTKKLEERVEKVQKMLPEGISIEPYLNRSELVKRNISTVVYNLIEGALIVFVVLIIFLGNVRAGLIVASIIPLAMLFAFIMMRIFGVSANLMSLGAIDFGIVVDGSIVIIEGIIAHGVLRSSRGKTKEMIVNEGANKVMKSAAFAVLIILIVFFPILTLTGIEGKYFTPMAQTLVFCIIGALILSLLYVPMMASLFLKFSPDGKPTIADKIFDFVGRYYHHLLTLCMRRAWITLTTSFLMLAASLMLFGRLGTEFIPTLDEGDFAMQMTLPAGSSLSHSVEVSLEAEKVLKEKFPEIKHVVAKIGTAEVPTDPMSVEDADVMIVMKPFKEWTSASSRAEMVEKMKEALDSVEGAEFNFSQPIQLRFNELMTGAKADIAIKLYGEDMDMLYRKAQEAAKYVEKVKGASDVIVEQTMGLPQLVIHYDRTQIARYGIDIKELNDIVRSAYAGETAGVVFENERRFDLVLRLDKEKVSDLDLNRLYVRTCNGQQIPVSQVANITLNDGPLQINRDAAKRRVVIGVNVRDADIGQVVKEISETLDKHITLPPGYYFEYGGQFENLQNAIQTLFVVIPIALVLILLLLFFAFRSVTWSLVVFSTVPLSLIGGIVALWMRGLPFSISAGVGFIALFGVAVLNGILMLNHFNDLQNQNKYKMCTDRIIFKGCKHLLRPVLLTGLVASLGFVPMAIAQSAGAEVQRPLATVVIGGLMVSTLLTLVVIPAFYKVINALPIGYKRKRSKKRISDALKITIGIIICMTTLPLNTQGQTLEETIKMALNNSRRLKMAEGETMKRQYAKGENWDGGYTQVSYAWGQLNGEYRRDYEFSVSQSLGNILTPFYQNTLNNVLIKESVYKRDIVAKEVTAETKRAWVDYLEAADMARLTKAYVKMGSELEKSGERRLKQGDISQLEFRVIASLAAELKTQAKEADNQLLIAKKRLSWVCNSSEELTPTDTTLSINSLEHKQQETGTGYLNWFDMQEKAKQKALSLERSKLSPELSVGYSLQKIAPLNNLHSWSVGVALPILFFPQRSRIKQAKAEALIAQWEAEDNRKELMRKVEELEIKMRSERERVEYYQKAAVNEANEMERSAMALYQTGEIDASELIQTLKMAGDIHRNAISTLHDYLVTVIEYELYR